MSNIALYFKNPIVKTDNNYLSAIIDKHKKLETTNPPRIILVGGSNLTFGVDSKEIQDSIGLPVINMGLHAGLGLPFMLGEIKNEIKQNDIILLSIEYYLQDGDYNLIYYVRKVYPKSASFLTFTLADQIRLEYKRLINNLNDYITQIQNNRFFWINLQKKSNDKVEIDTNKIYIAYRRNSLSENGDILPSLTTISLKKLFDRNNMVKAYYTEYIEKLNKFGKDSKVKEREYIFYSLTIQNLNMIKIKKQSSFMKAN